MSRTINHLKPLTVEREKTIGRHADGGGLYLVVKPGPRRSWAFLYRRGGKTTELGLGSTSDVSLVAARAEATELRAILSAGGDPNAHRERKRQAKALEDARSITFETAAAKGVIARRSPILLRAACLSEPIVVIAPDRGQQPAGVPSQLASDRSSPWGAGWARRACEINARTGRLFQTR
jgi:hypothetical protein